MAETMAQKRGVNCLKFSLLAGFLLLLQPVFSQYNFSEIDNLLTKNVKLLGNGVAALIYKDGKVIYTKELGEDFKIKTQAPVSAASNWLTAALIMTFVDQGKLSLDDPVTKYIPIFASYSKKYITIRHCLTNTTGIEAEPGIKAFLTRKKFPSLEEEATSFAKREIERNPGDMFFFSNIGLNLAGRVLEIISKKTFDRLIQERLLRPLKMRTTTFVVDYDQAPNPSGGAYSTAIDYMNFLTMILNKGTFETKRILSEDAIAEMQKMQTGKAELKYVPKACEGYSYGFGTWIMEADAKGNGTVVSCPGLFGAWNIVDYCRGYACVIIVKKTLDEQKKDMYMAIKEIIDQQIPCKQ